jgi:uncharacterized 2Fe-2S/4Fe-4S cluster protein (DUF4445 family)
MGDEVSVRFLPAGRGGRVAAGSTVLDAARALGVDLDSICGGRGLCGRCQVEADGSLSAIEATEARFAERRTMAAGRRLGCQARLLADATVSVPPEHQVHRQVIAKAAGARTIRIDPVITLHHVLVDQPDMHDPRSDATRLAEALHAQWGVTTTVPPLAVLATLQAALRAGAWAVTVALRHRRDVVAVWPGLVDRAVGAAIDLGSTTIAAHLCDLASGAVLASGGVMNPQIRMGEDLMSRVAHAMQVADGTARLAAAARGAVASLLADLARTAGIAADRLLELTLVGNPVMHHLFLGLDPHELGGAPFALAADMPIDVPAREVQLPAAPGAHVHLLPCIAGHVGADAAAMVLAEAPHETDALTLLVDVGTNAELVLGNRLRLLACSSPTGPAFEGAQISAGQRAAPGAIERVRIDRATFEPRFKVIGCDAWSDAAAFAAAPTGICGSGIIEAVAELFLAGVIGADGAIDGTLAARTWRVREEHRSHTYIIREAGPRIAITQHDVRAIQLAKAALRAGAALLLLRAGVAAPDRIRLAGAFGAHIDPLYALVLGLVPDCPPEAIASVGNAAGDGARIALLNAASRRAIAQLVRRIEKIETALEPDFQAEFVAAMAIPHATAPHPNLARLVALPPRPAAGARRRAAAPRPAQDRPNA